jgi:hypothetical protein
MSINSKVFVKTLVAAVEGSDVEPKLDISHQGRIWNIFVQRLLWLGYMIPGTVAQLGQTDLSRVVKWPEDGIKYSHTFRNIRYGGGHNTINEIPSLELHLDSALEEATIFLTNGNRYLIGQDDLEKVICITPGKYPLIKNTARGRSPDLETTENVVNSALYEAIFRLNRIIAEYNSYQPVLGRRGSVLTRLSFSRDKSEDTHLKEIKGSGRLTSNIAKLIDQILAIAYKVEGRKITRRDLLRNLASDIRTVNAVTRVLGAAMQCCDNWNATERVRQMVNQRRRSLIRIREYIAQAEDNKTRIATKDHGGLSDEPISKVLYPNGSAEATMPVWHDYRSWYSIDENTLYVDAQRQMVERVQWITDAIIEVSSYGMQAKFLLSPLDAVSVNERDDEIRPNDAIILLGQYVVVEPGEERSAQSRESITNRLKIIGIEQYPATKRGMNRTQNSKNSLQRWAFR